MAPVMTGISGAARRRIRRRVMDGGTAGVAGALGSPCGSGMGVEFVVVVVLLHRAAPSKGLGCRQHIRLLRLWGT